MEGRRERGPDLQKRKPRRGTIRGSAAEPQVRECLENGGTLKEASTILNDNNGYSPSLMAISRYRQSVQEEAEQARELEAAVSAVMRHEDVSPGCDLAVLARKALLVRALHAIQRLPEDAIEGRSLDRLSLIVSRLERSGVMTDGVRLASERLEKEHPEPEPPGAAYRQKLADMAEVEAITMEFLAKERAQKLAARPRPETQPQRPGEGGEGSAPTG